MSQQKVTLKASGLHTFPNLLASELPAGALVQADNVIINRDGVIEPARGFKIYGNAMGVTTTNIAKQFLLYKDRILRHYDNILQADNGSGVFTSYSGTYSEVESGLRLRGVESNGNLYFTSSVGIKKISALLSSDVPSAIITPSGGIKALDNKVTLNSSPGFFTQESVIAYRIVWGIKDANTNLILGVPSERSIIYNSLTPLLISNFNTLLTDLDAAAPVSGADDLSDIDYFSSLNVTTGLASSLQTSMSTLCTKLDADITLANFTTVIKTAIDAIVLSATPTSGQLVALQDQYDAIVNQLNSYIGAGASPKINGTVSDFSLSTQSQTVDLNITIPEEITSSYFYQVYRTAITVSDGVTVLSELDPGDECGLVYEANPTAGDLTAGFLTIQDITPDSFRGANLYTNPNSGEGILQANEVPPKAKDITLFKNYLFYGNTETKYRKRVSLLSVSDLIAGTSSINITDGVTSNTYTFNTAENVATKQVLISTLDTPSLQVNETSRSLVHVINRNNSELVYAYYLSGPSDVPGLILLESRTLGQNAFYVTANTTLTGGQFSPALPTSGNSIIADNEVSPNRVYYSKVSQPEAVPLLNYFDVGPKNKKILRIIALRESLFVFKEEGVYRVSGDTAPFVLNLFDSSTLLTARDSAYILNNEIYLLSDQGIAKASDTGVSIMSRAIEGELIKLNTPKYPAYGSATFSVSYESDRSFFLWTVTNPSDTVATQCFKYNTFTNSWTKLIQSKNCAVVSTADDLLYLGPTDINFIEQERKSFDRTDYSNREYDFTLANGSIEGNVIDLSSVSKVEERDVLLQTQYLTINQYNRILTKLDLDNGVTDTNYSSLLTATPGSDLRILVGFLAAKLDADTTVAQTNYASAISGYTSSFPDTQLAFNVIVNKLNIDAGVVGSNYLLSVGTTPYEIIIISINKQTNQITTQLEYPFIAGLVTIFKHIDCVVRWSPEPFGDPSMLKQVSDATLIFEKISFSDISLGFSSDINPGFEFNSFHGSDIGVFGTNVFGEQIFGGDGNAIPFRTYVPREKQRCRFLNAKFIHGTARETFAIFGLSFTVTPTSQRAYR